MSSIILSFDYELFWGVYHKGEKYIPNVAGASTFVLKVLDLCEKNRISTSWAVVGRLFSSFEELTEFFETKKVSKTMRHPEYWIVPSVLKEKLQQIDGIDIMSHTYSHVYSDEFGISEEFKDDTRLWIEDSRIPNVNGIIFPRNVYSTEMLSYLRKLGFKYYRKRSLNSSKFSRLIRILMDYTPLVFIAPSVQINDTYMYGISDSYFIRPDTGFRLLDRLKWFKIELRIRLAIRKGSCVHFWCHPHNFGKFDKSLENWNTFLERLGKYRDKHDLKIVNMKEFYENSNFR